MTKHKCISCPNTAMDGSVYCKTCARKVHTASDPAPKGTFKKKVTSSKAKIMTVN